MTNSKRYDDREGLSLIDAGGCARFGAAAETCRWKCGNQCAHPAPNPTANGTFAEVLRQFVTRRPLLRGAAAAAVGLVVAPQAACAEEKQPEGGQEARQEEQTPPPVNATLSFQPITLGNEDRIVVPSGYSAEPLIRWGDPLFGDAPAFNYQAQSAAAQARQFGYNNDFIGFFPMLQRSDDRALLVVNHEYTNPELMFAGYSDQAPTREQVDIELAAHGLTVVEVQRRNDEWSYVANSSANRRITGETQMMLTGPAAGSPLLQTAEDPGGRTVRGMLNNCSAGKTPWGTVLTCEENFNQYFANLDDMPEGDARKAVHRRYGLTRAASERKWERFHPRFDLAQEPNEAFRFGWVVEIDPHDPNAVPRKRTALGRFKHEAAQPMVGPDGRVGVYMGDDERFDYVYKFVTAGRVNTSDRSANRDLLDTGTLYVARLNGDGSGEWLPLIFGQGPLTTANGFASQADVLIKTRLAGDAVGATKMDRPEDIEPNPVNKKVYMAMTNNTNRTEQQIDKANPRANNRHGHIIELTEENNDPTATRFTWDIFMLCGPTDDASRSFAGFPKEQVSPISSPDNLIFDRGGNLWIFTDGQPGTIRVNDAVYAVPVEGAERGNLKPFLSGVPGSETASGDFSAENDALFVSIQHPGEGARPGQPITTFPSNEGFPRPSVVVAWRSGDGEKRIGA